MTTATPEPADSAGTEPVPAEPPSAPAATRPPNNIGWAVASLLFFWPLSFSAFSHALNVFPLWSEGDQAGAGYASRRARWLGILSLWIGGALIVLFAVCYLIMVLVLIHHGHPHHQHGWYQPTGPKLVRPQ